MQQYQNLLKEILAFGHTHPDRTGVGRKSIFGCDLRFDMSDGTLPLVTSRYINPEMPIVEMLMFIYGKTNVDFLNEQGLKFWNPWAVNEKTAVNLVEKLAQRGIIREEQRIWLLENYSQQGMGEIGPMYGHMWRMWPTASESFMPVFERDIKDMASDFVESVTRAWEGLEPDQQKHYTLENWIKTHYRSIVDQLSELVYHLKNDPFSSRMIVTALNPEFTPFNGYSPDENVLLSKGALMPCHFSFQCMVTPPRQEGGKNVLNLQMNQRSVDSYLGLPVNIAEYGLLLALLAHTCNLDRGELRIVGTDVHLYTNQFELAAEIVQNEPYPLPQLVIKDSLTDFFKVKRDDIEVIGYEHHAHRTIKPAV